MKIAKTLSKVMLPAVFAISSMAASASSLTFDFTGKDYYPSRDLTFDVHGVELTVTSGTFSFYDSDINFNTRFVDLDNDGLGSLGFFDGDQVDGRFGNDVLVFSFSEFVSIDNILFGNVDNNDDFAFGEVNGSFFDRVFDFNDVFASVGVNSGPGLTFGIGAIGSNDNFSIRGLEISKVAVPELDAAGAPIALSLIAGFLAMAAERRRRRRIL